MSRIEERSKEIREKLLIVNTYKENDPYNSAHKNALSDGDNKGKGENNKSIGGSKDIEARSKLNLNKYGVVNMYDDSKA